MSLYFLNLEFWSLNLWLYNATNTLPEERALRRAILSDKVAVPLMVIMEEENYRHDRMLKQVKEYFRSIDKRNMSTAGESLVALYNHRLRDPNSRLKTYSDM